MLQFAELVVQKIGSNSNIKFFDLPEDDPKKRCPDISLAKEILNWEPKISLNHGLDNTINWYTELTNDYF